MNPVHNLNKRVTVVIFDEEGNVTDTRHVTRGAGEAIADGFENAAILTPAEYANRFVQGAIEAMRR